MTQFSDTILQLISDILPPAASAALGWYIGKRKSKAEAVKSEVENIGEGLALYRVMIDDLKIRLQTLQDDIRKLEVEYSDLKKKLEISETDNAKLRKRIVALEKCNIQ